MINIVTVDTIECATHIYVLEGNDSVVEGISSSCFYKINSDKRTVVDDEGKINYAWNMTDYAFIKVAEI